MLLRTALSGHLDGARLTKRQRLDALEEAAQYYHPVELALEVARAIQASHHER
jgi:hypothetical protein